MDMANTLNLGAAKLCYFVSFSEPADELFASCVSLLDRRTCLTLKYNVHVFILK